MLSEILLFLSILDCFYRNILIKINVMIPLIYNIYKLTLKKNKYFFIKMSEEKDEANQEHNDDDEHGY